MDGQPDSNVALPRWKGSGELVGSGWKLESHVVEKNVLVAKQYGKTGEYAASLGRVRFDRRAPCFLVRHRTVPNAIYVYPWKRIAVVLLALLAAGCSLEPGPEPEWEKRIRLNFAATVKRCEELGGVAVLNDWANHMERCDFPCAASQAERSAR